MSTDDLISVVVTTYNRSDALLCVLSGLACQTDHNFEVVVADDGSSLAHQRVVMNSGQSQQLDLTHVWHPDVGFTASKARNRGVAVSKGTYIVFLDGDCVPNVDFIAQHRRLAQSNCLVNGSRVLLSPALTSLVLKMQSTTSQNANISLMGRSWAYWLQKRLLGDINKLTHLLRLPNGAYRMQKHFIWKGIRSCNMGISRMDFERVDGFDESFEGWGHEDADFVLRLHHAGVQRKNGFCATEVYHLWHQEAQRHQESVNALKVRNRMKSGQIVSDRGYAQTMHQNDVVVTKLDREVEKEING
ncbi:MAG: glycosyltransferase [Betaproteobacteria bacterium]|nr:glycosyltransferase [Betaproteobacteria bacterium]